MRKKKTFTLYTHHHTAVHMGAKKRRSVDSLAYAFFYKAGVFALWLPTAPFRLLYKICFSVGNAVVQVIVKTFKAAVTEADRTIESFGKRLALFKARKFRESMGMFLLVCLLGWGFFLTAKVVAHALELKDTITRYALNGNDHLTQAEEALKAQNFAEADSQFESALQNFNKTGEEIGSTGQLLSGLLDALPQKRGAEKLAEAGVLIAQSGRQMVAVSSRLSNFSITPEGVSSKQNFADDMQYISQTLQEVSQELSKTSELFSQVDPGILPGNQALQFTTARGKVDMLKTSMQSLSHVFSMVEDLTVGEKNVLVLFENNNELRATGGFIGTYGNFKLRDGKIENLHISSIYDLDGQLRENIVPPTPILNVNSRWYMRDSNWFVSFPDSAKKVSSFYEKEGGETPDLVIALTPKLVSDWLKITGPIDMRSFGVTFDSENFVERMQALSDGSTESPLNNPKQIMADFFPVLLQRLSELPPEKYPQVVQAIVQNFSEKHILLYSRNTDLQQQFESYDWAGAALPTDRDSLLVVSSNLGGTKTDLFMDQDIHVETEISKNGDIVNHLTIARKNRMPYMEGTANISYVRVLVPKGSKLLESQGFNYKNLDSQDLKDYKTDPDVYNWEKSSVREVVTGMNIGEEAGKTYFGNWVEVQGGDTRTVKLSYKLPFKLQDLDHYSMLLQKQAGTQNQKFTQTISFPGRKLIWKNFTESELGTESLKLSVPYERDLLLGSIFTKK